MVSYLKGANVKIRCDHSPLHKFVYSLTKNDKVNNWSQGMHVITQCIDFEHIKVRDNILAEISRLKTLSLYEANYAKEPGSKYGKSI